MTEPKPLIQKLAERLGWSVDHLTASNSLKLLFELCAHIDEQAKPECSCHGSRDGCEANCHPDICDCTAVAVAHVVVEPPPALEEPLVPDAEGNPEALWPSLMARLRAMPNAELLAFDFEGVGIAIQKELAARAAQLDEARATLARAEHERSWRRQEAEELRRELEEAREALARVEAFAEKQGERLRGQEERNAAEGWVQYRMPEAADLVERHSATGISTFSSSRSAVTLASSEPSEMAKVIASRSIVAENERVRAVIEAAMAVAAQLNIDDQTTASELALYRALSALDQAASEPEATERAIVVGSTWRDRKSGQEFQFSNYAPTNGWLFFVPCTEQQSLGSAIVNPAHLHNLYAWVSDPEATESAQRQWPTCNGCGRPANGRFHECDTESTDSEETT